MSCDSHGLREACDYVESALLPAHYQITSIVPQRQTVGSTNEELYFLSCLGKVTVPSVSPSLLHFRYLSLKSVEPI